MMEEMTKKKVYATSYEILKLIGKGLVAAVLLTSPYAGKALIKCLAEEIKKKVNPVYDQGRLVQSLQRLTQGDLIKITHQDGREMVELTAKGRQKLLLYDLKQLTLAKPAKWDGLWRVVIFDVGEQKRSFRNALRWQLRSMNFYRLQESVFVTPYPCEKEIALLREHYEIKNEVVIITAVKLENEEVLKKEFGLRGSQI
jgi:CRISPR-associated endonuclease Cas2